MQLCFSNHGVKKKTVFFAPEKKMAAPIEESLASKKRRLDQMDRILNPIQEVLLRVRRIDGVGPR